MAREADRRRKRKRRSLKGLIRTARELVTNQILDRWDEAYREGHIREIADPSTGEVVLVITGGLYRACHLLSPADYPLKLDPPAPTATAPGSPARVEEYRRRVESGQHLYASGDENHMTGAVIVERLNGMGRRVLGRSGELEQERNADDER